MSTIKRSLIVAIGLFLAGMIFLLPSEASRGGRIASSPSGPGEKGRAVQVPAHSTQNKMGTIKSPPYVSQAVAFRKTPAVKDVITAKFSASDILKKTPEIALQEINSLEISRSVVDSANKGSSVDAAINNFKRTSGNSKGMFDLVSNPIQNFDGPDMDTGQPLFGFRLAPPSPNAAVGPNHIVVATNAGFQIFNKSGVALTAQAKISTLLVGVANASDDDGNPIVLYDSLADRWLMSQTNFRFTGNQMHHHLAISATGDPTGSWFAYDFLTSPGKFNSLPMLGVWPDGYYMSTIDFTPPSGFPLLGAGFYAFEREKLLVGDPTAKIIGFNTGPTDFGLLPSHFQGFTPPPAGTPNLFVEFFADEFGDTDSIRVFEFRPNFNTPAASTLTQLPNIPVAAFDPRSPSGRSDVEQPAPGELLDALPDRLLHPINFRVLPGGVQSFVLNWEVNVSGVNPTSAALFQGGVRWMELRRNAGTGVITINQEATYAPGSGSGTGRDLWAASISQDGEGNIGLAASATAPGPVPAPVNPTAVYTGRLASDPANTLPQGEVDALAAVTKGIQTGTANRWGDYQSNFVDPADDCTFWGAFEYVDAPTSSFDWNTRVFSFKVNPLCVTPPKGTFSGTVTDCTTGLPIQGATVQTADGFIRTTDASGNYGITASPATYGVEITKAGGYNTVNANVTVTNGGNAILNACLQPSPVIVSAGATIVSESCSPANGAIDPDETVTISLCVQNTGSVNTSNLVGTLPNTGGVTAASGPQNYGVVVAGGPPVCRNFTFTANGSCGGTITASLQLQDGASNLGTVTYTFTLGTVAVAFTENFDGVTAPNLPAGWTTSFSNGAGCALGSLWATTTAAPVDTAPNSAFHDDPSCTTDGALTSPSIAITSASARLTFRNNFNLESGFDGGVLEIAIGAGPFTDIITAGGSFVAGGYNGTIGAATNPLNGRPAWTGNGGGFITTTVNLPAAAAGQNILLRWRLGTDNSVNGVGWKVDTINVTDGFECSSCSAPACTITCPANITKSNDPNQCGAVTTYPAPTTTGACGTVTCSPASGSFFPVGTTTVTCTSTAGPTCSFTVTVNDTQPPTVTCPSPITATGAADTVGTVVNFTATASDNCPGVVVACTPPSGSSFPQGTTTVTCTATDNSGNTATCSTTVTVNIPPGANDDHYFTFVNQPLTVPAPGVLSNDTGFPAPTAVAASGSTTAGGTFTLTFNGQVTYTPPAGFTGNDGFDYTATNTAGSDTAHVTLTVTDPATISLRISEFRENGPGAGGLAPAMVSSSKSGDDIVIEVLNPARDEFIEIYNHTPTDVQVGTTLPSNNGGLGVFASAGNGVTDNVVTLVCRIPDGTIIRAKGYLLCTNRGEGGGYSMNSFGFRGSRTGGPTSPTITGSGQTAVGDLPIINGTPAHPGAFTAVDIPNDAGLVLANVGENTVGASSNVPDNGDFGFGATGVSPLSFTVYDRIGFAPYGSGAPLQTCQLANTAGCGSSGSARPSLADNYCEGGAAGCLRPVGDASTTNHGATVFYGDSGQYSLLRRQTTLNAEGTTPQDTNNNAQDILMVAPKPGINIAFNITNFPTGAGNGLVSVLGAAGPQNRHAPPDLPDPSVLQSRLFDIGRTLNQLPNAERRYVIDNGGSPENAGNMNTTIAANNPIGSFIFRFGFRNVSSATLQQLRFRIDQLAVPCGQASPSPSVAITGSGNARNLSQTSPNCQGTDNQTAVLKVLNMPTEVVARESIPAGTPETVRGSVIEDTGNSPGGAELAQNGGGINNSLVRTGSAQGSFTGEYSTVVPAGGPYFFMAFRLGVVRGGSFKFIIQPEGLPSPVAEPDNLLLMRRQ